MIIEMLRKHEGVEKYAYKCTADKVTIGVGRYIDKSSSMGLSDDEIDYLLSNDIKRVSAELIRAFPWYSELDEVRKDAMIDMCFNMGLPRLSKFKNSLAAMKNGDYDIAAIEFLDSNWAKQVGNRSITITDMIRSGEY